MAYTIKQALTICEEMQKWRRGKRPYNGTTPKTHRQMPFSPREWGEAMDCLIKFTKETIKAQDFFAGMSAAAGFKITPEIVTNDD